MAPVLAQGATLQLGDTAGILLWTGPCFHTIVVSVRCYSSSSFFPSCGLDPAFKEREGSASRLRCLGSRERSEAHVLETGIRTHIFGSRK